VRSIRFTAPYGNYDGGADTEDYLAGDHGRELPSWRRAMRRDHVELDQRPGEVFARVARHLEHFRHPERALEPQRLVREAQTNHEERVRRALGYMARPTERGRS
jgi:hypothetical protein